MRIIYFILILLALTIATSTNAQPTATSPEATSPSNVVEKFQIINKGEANQRCSSETLVKCLKITKEDCESASNAAAEVANAEIDKATGGKELSAFDAGFYQGKAMATFMMEMQKRTDNRFIKCVQKN
jgi:hypothetical protein